MKVILYDRETELETIELSARTVLECLPLLKRYDATHWQFVHSLKRCKKCTGPFRRYNDGGY